MRDRYCPTRPLSSETKSRPTTSSSPSLYWSSLIDHPQPLPNTPLILTWRRTRCRLDRSNGIWQLTHALESRVLSATPRGALSLSALPCDLHRLGRIRRRLYGCWLIRRWLPRVRTSTTVWHRSRTHWREVLWLRLRLLLALYFSSPELLR